MHNIEEFEESINGAIDSTKVINESKILKERVQGISQGIYSFGSLDDEPNINKIVDYLNSQKVELKELKKNRS
ncbi:hypothetical protein [Pleomorphovibrio marinus]|uniref:hypothetical protein n=1 Tax=Pleomorphovibrio marinus TaxID=2164132 RepID=UPI000E0C307F|nr:hypothetical protein [Pleomorphovibrio marinus]